MNQVRVRESPVTGIPCDARSNAPAFSLLLVKLLRRGRPRLASVSEDLNLNRTEPTEPPNRFGTRFLNSTSAGGPEPGSGMLEPGSGMLRCHTVRTGGPNRPTRRRPRRQRTNAFATTLHDQWHERSSRGVMNAHPPRSKRKHHAAYPGAPLAQCAAVQRTKEPLAPDQCP